MAVSVSFGGAVKASAPAVYDATLSTGNGAAMFGIGFTGADGAALPGTAQYIGNPIAPVVKLDTDANIATP